MKVGILAYGSFIPDPGWEIENARTRIIRDVETPFCIEFARKSKGRMGAPTLVPVEVGGARVRGQVFEMNLSEKEATDVLYRREINKVGSDKKYKRPDTPGGDSVLVERIPDFAGLDVVLYTKIAANIDKLTPDKLACYAIGSVTKDNLGRDGITYLLDAKKARIQTPLSADYEAAILRRTGCETLEHAREQLLES